MKVDVSPSEVLRLRTIVVVHDHDSRTRIHLVINYFLDLFEAPRPTSTFSSILAMFTRKEIGDRTGFDAWVFD
jgi:hypothetical protein